MLPRSSNKPVQATALLAAGWAPRSAQELAIGAGSHNGEDGHRELAAAMLAAAGLGARRPRLPAGAAAARADAGRVAGRRAARPSGWR